LQLLGGKELGNLRVEKKSLGGIGRAANREVYILDQPIVAQFQNRRGGTEQLFPEFLAALGSRNEGNYFPAERRAILFCFEAELMPVKRDRGEGDIRRIEPGSAAPRSEVSHGAGEGAIRMDDGYGCVYASGEHFGAGAEGGGKKENKGN